MKIHTGIYKQPVNKDGRFENEYHPHIPGLSDILKWKRNPSGYLKTKKAEFKAEPLKMMPVTLIDSITTIADNSITWLGHASFFLKLGGKSILIDPVFGTIAPFSKRYSVWPIAPELLTGIDIILLSHDHRDHCDMLSLKQLIRQNPGVLLLTGKSMGDLFLSFKNLSIQEAKWYGQYELNSFPFTITFLPTRHWAKRLFTDTNKRLWGSFWIEFNGKKLYFGGDTGYDEHFKHFHTQYGTPDWYMVGIGAFAPEWFMQSNHMSPADALIAIKELDAKNVIPMHFGTFDLSDESPFEPPRALKKLITGTDLQNRIHFPVIGETLLI